MTSRSDRSQPHDAVARAARWIDGSDDLPTLCEQWARAPFLALDTEFVRERTFFAHLGLIQIGVPKEAPDGDESQPPEAFLIDPLAVDLEPLAQLVADPELELVLHSPSEDLEVLHQRLGVVPRGLFDTQIAAAFAGLGWSMGYSRLVSELLGIDLPKGETRSNWLARPLREAQRHYAALDVVFLPPVRRRLAKALDSLGRRAWFDEEMAALEDPERFIEPEDATFNRLRRGRGTRRQLGILRGLARWRDAEARRRDLPRSFVVPDAALIDLAAKAPRSHASLAKTLEKHRLKHRDRYTQPILDAVREGLALPEAELPERQPRPTDLMPHKKAVNGLRKRVEHIAEREGLPRELLATRKTVESLARRVLDKKKPPLPRSLRGWRRSVVGDELVELARATLLS